MIIDGYEDEVAAKEDDVFVVFVVSVLNLLINMIKKSDRTYSHIEFYFLSRFIG